MTDYEYLPQQKHSHRVELFDRQHKLLKRRRMDVWSGEPVGDWVEFRDIRIALRRLSHNKFEGIVPDNSD
jgi:hypothetical protein